MLFEHDLIAFVENIRLIKRANYLRKTIRKQIQVIKLSDKTVILTNKTTNINRLAKT